MTHECPHCDGDGYIEIVLSQSPQRITARPCPHCRTTGLAAPRVPLAPALTLALILASIAILAIATAVRETQTTLTPEDAQAPAWRTFAPHYTSRDM